MAPVIDVINQSTVLKGAAGEKEIAALVGALQQQVTHDFSPFWNRDASVNLTPQSVNPKHWQLVLLDDSDQADALGYHELTAGGQPLGKVFVKSTIDDGLNWTITASHELLEMLADPDINLSAEFDDQTGAPSKFYAYEVCDACEDDSFAYSIDGVMVSDFVTPEWFMQNVKAGAFDCEGHVKAPFQLLSGGYIGEYIPGQGWTQIDAEESQLRAASVEAFGKKAPNTRSKERILRRNRPRAEWRLSKI